MNQLCPPLDSTSLLGFFLLLNPVPSSEDQGGRRGRTSLLVFSLVLLSNRVLKFTAQWRELCLPGRKHLKRGIFGGSMMGLTLGFL